LKKVQLAEYICRHAHRRSGDAQWEARRTRPSGQTGEKVSALSINLDRNCKHWRAFGGEQHVKKIKVEDFLLFNQQLSALLRAGLPILQAIGILRKRVHNEQLRITLEDVEAKVRAGQALSEAFAAQGDAFPRIYIASILAGERAGSLDEVLLRYVSYQKTITEARRKIKKSLAYPAVLVAHRSSW
jgi:type II secretory pathway component PulF